MTTKAKTLRPFKSIPPGDILREELEACGWTQSEFAEIIGKPIQTVSEIVNGKKAITPETAVLFEEALGTSAEYWLNLESSYRLDLLAKVQNNTDEFVERKARLFNIAPVSEMIRLNWISCNRSRGRYTERQIDQIEKEILKYYQVKQLSDIQPLAANFRKSSSEEHIKYSLQAWLTHAKREASKLKAKRYNKKTLLEEIHDLVELSAEKADFERIRGELLPLGVRLVHVPHLSRTRLDGAAFWLDAGAPVVAVTLRLNRVDNFWFTVMHELAHILFHTNSKDAPMIDEDITEPGEDDKESEADKYAQDWLIAPEEFARYKTARDGRYTTQSVRKFAEEISIHPSIVVGRLQHDGEIPFSHMRNVLERFH